MLICQEEGDTRSLNAKLRTLSVKRHLLIKVDYQRKKGKLQYYLVVNIQHMLASIAGPGRTPCKH